MSTEKKWHFLIFATKKLSNQNISFLSEIPATADVVTDLETVASKVEITLPDAIVIIEDKEKECRIVNNLRLNSKVDQVPILSFNSLEEATKILPFFVKGKL